MSRRLVVVCTTVVAITAALAVAGFAFADESGRTPRREPTALGARQAAAVTAPPATAPVPTAAAVTAPPATAPAPTAPPTAPPPTLSQPEDPPTDVYADVPVTRVGTVRIPKIGLEHPVFEGIWLTVIDNGPGHWPGTARPGEYGNTVFAGHRVTHTHPFRNLDRLVAGDEVLFDTDRGTFTYAVTGTRIVGPRDTWIVDQEPGYTMTLFACHPPGSAAERIVVTGELVRAPVREIGAPRP